MRNIRAENEGKTQQKFKKPSIFLFIAEHFRVWKELWTSYTFQKSYRPSSKGDGHPVLVLPGFMTSDWSTNWLRKFVRQLGYSPYPWGLGRNYGDIRKLNPLLEKLETLNKKHQAKVTIIGWSLGGIYARQLAKAKPELVRQIITLGSPFANVEQPNNATWLYKLINDRRKLSDKDKKWIEDLSSPAPVPTTAIYSKEDGIVSWQTCIEVEDDFHQNIEVTGGHFSMGNNPEVWGILEDRLLYTAETWKKYEKP